MFISGPRGGNKISSEREKSGPVENFHGKPELYLDFGGESAKSAKSIQIKNCSGPRIPICSSWKNVNGSLRTFSHREDNHLLHLVSIQLIETKIKYY